MTEVEGSASGNLVSSPDNGNKPHTKTYVVDGDIAIAADEREAERPPAEGLRGPSWSLTALLTILSAPSLSLSLHLSLFLSRPDPLAFYGTRDATSPFRFVRRQERKRGENGQIRARRGDRSTTHSLFLPGKSHESSATPN